MKKIEYAEMDPLEHCLKRPDTYISGIRNVQRDEWIVEKEKSDEKEESDEKEPRLLFRSISSNPGLERLFVEAQSNAIDNLWRSSEAGVKQTFIELQADDGWTSVRNDGRVIALERHSSGMWNPELVFGRLRTSSNYDDTEERMTSGKNGLGIKLTNIYSLEFQVEIFDKETSMKYEQSWSDHMRNRSEAVLTKVKKAGQPKGSYTLVRWRPDFAYFSLERYPSDMISLFARYAHDTAMVTGLNVSFNGSPVAAKTMKLYSKLLGGECLFLESKDAKVVISASEEYRQLSFVNGCYTCEGGAHVDAWTGPLFRGIAERIEAKLKIKITARDIKKYFTFVVSATVARPEFSSQSKNFLVAPSVEHAVDDRALSAVMRWDFVKSVADESKAKEMVGLKKAEKRGYVKVEVSIPPTLRADRRRGSVRS